MAVYTDLEGKVAVITGGSGSLGAATCHALVANAARVAVNGRNAASVERVVAELRQKGGHAVAVPADCTDSAALEKARERVESELGPVSILVAFAGGGRQPQPVDEITEESWRDDIERNLTATFLTVKTFLPGMMKTGGSIVTMASSAARRPGGAPIAYAAAKAGIVNFTQQLAHSVAGAGIRANCIAPSTVVNDRMRAMPEERRRELAKLYPLGRLGVPEDVANATLFLVSDASAWITGVTLDIAGGQVML